MLRVKDNLVKDSLVDLDKDSLADLVALDNRLLLKKNQMSMI